MKQGRGKINLPRKVLVIKFSAIGDLVLTVPALRAIRQAFPSARISLLVVKGYEGILHACPYIDETLTLERPFRRSFPPLDFFRFTRFLFLLSGKHFDEVFNFQGNARSYLIEIFTSPGWKRKWNAFGNLLFQIFAPPAMKGGRRQKGYPVEVQLGDLKKRGIPPAGAHLEFFFSTEEISFANAFLSRYPFLTTRTFLLGINPGVNWESKEYFEERYAGVADNLVKHYGAGVLLFGGPEDIPKAEAVLRAMKHPEEAVICAGQTPTPNHAAALISRCSLFITNDTGLMHLSAAVGVPTLSIFGGTNPLFHAPKAEPHIALCKGQSLPCWPCYRYHCQIPDNRKCLKMISVSEVLSSADSLLAHPARVLHLPNETKKVPE